MKSLFLALTLSLATSAFAGDQELALVQTDFDKDGKPDTVAVYDASTEEEPFALNLVVAFGNGLVIENKGIIHNAGHEEPAVALKLLGNGSVRVTTFRDWGTSNWQSDLYLSFREGALKISGLDHSWAYQERHGKCEFNFLSGKSLVNGKAVPYSAPAEAFTADSNVDIHLDTCIGLSE